jgi:hypothetical protein
MTAEDRVDTILARALHEALAKDAGHEHFAYLSPDSDLARQATRLITLMFPAIRRAQSHTVQSLANQLEAMEGSRLNLATTPSVRIHTARDIEQFLDAWATHYEVLAAEAEKPQAAAHEHDWEVEYIADLSGNPIRSGMLACRSCNDTREDR